MLYTKDLYNKTKLLQKFYLSVVTNTTGKFKIEIVKKLHELKGDYYNKWYETPVASSVKVQIDNLETTLTYINQSKV